MTRQMKEYLAILVALPVLVAAAYVIAPIVLEAWSNPWFYRHIENLFFIAVALFFPLFLPLIIVPGAVIVVASIVSIILTPLIPPLTAELNAKSGKTMLVVHNIVYTALISAVVYFGMTLWGSILVLAAVALPLILLAYETKGAQKTGTSYAGGTGRLP